MFYKIVKYWTFFNWLKEITLSPEEENSLFQSASHAVTGKGCPNDNPYEYYFKK